ncbi:hypothetical protein KBC86_00695 [Candidatus Gracilibacteria bacterium]|nr:hypothetical protein [Candidatus Gracilibacteria bacterium]
MELTLYESVPAGLPFTPETSPGSPLDITKHLVEHPASSYLVRVRGDSMEGVGIYAGDIVVLDRGRTPRDGDIVIASLDGEVTLKTLEKTKTKIRLLPANPKYNPIEISGPCEIMGVVVGSFRKYH